MAIAEQFAGLDMKQLIGGPLSAAADASLNLASSTADFINKVGFDANGKLRTVEFAYQKRSMNEDGTSNLDEMKVDIPMLAIVPIPNLQVDEVNILFDMEVKQSERSESSMDLGATISGTMNLGIIKVSVSGSVSSHSSNTRSSDNSAKYHVDVRATNHGIPEGLARVLDMMAANVAPTLVGSSIKDGNGQNLSEQARIRAEKLKALRQEISLLEKQHTAAKDGLHTVILQMKRAGTSQLHVYQGILEKKLNEQNAEEKQEKYSRIREEVGASWNDFMNRAADIVETIAADEGLPDKLSEILALKGVTKEGEIADYSKEVGSYYEELYRHQNNAVKRLQSVKEIEQTLMEKNMEYSDAVANRTQPALPEKTGNADKEQ